MKREFDKQGGRGLTLEEFVYVMKKAMGPFVFNITDFAVQLVELFRQVDVNGDGTLEWEEFTSFLYVA